MVSLKLYMARMGAKKIQDLPYDPHQKPNWKSILEEIGDVEYRIAEVKVLIEINRRAN